MTATSSAPPRVIEGTITWVKARPIRSIDFELDGSGQALRLSGFARPVPVIPARGTLVRVTLDKSGYVRSIETLF